METWNSRERVNLGREGPSPLSSIKGEKGRTMQRGGIPTMAPGRGIHLSLAIDISQKGRDDSKEHRDFSQAGIDVPGEDLGGWEEG